MKTFLLLLIAFLAPLPVPAQVTPFTVVTLTNVPATLASGTASNSLNSYVPILQNSGLAVQWIYNTSSGNGSTSALYFFPSADGTNYATTNAWILPSLSTGTTNVVATTNWSAATLAGYSGLFLLTATNGTAGTLTNKSLLVTRWNPPRSN